jgi:hypothetical protein
MRSSSNWRSAVAILLCTVLTGEWAAPFSSPAAEEPPEPALLLKYAAPDIPEASSREVLDPVAGFLAADLRVRWVAVPVEEAAPAMDEPAYPPAGDSALRSIASKISRAATHMERVEGGAARTLLSEAESDARRYRYTEEVRPFLAEIFLRQGMLLLWEGDAVGAEAQLSRFRALRPDFSPDPALFPPQFLAVWDNVSRRPLPHAELLIESLPSGARITVDGIFAGTTPARIRPGTEGPVQLRVSHPGYRDVVRTGQWLPGDAESISFTLPGDRAARLGDLLGRPAGRGDGAGAAAAIAEFGQAAGVRRIAVVTLEGSSTGDGYIARLYSGSVSGEEPLFLGATEVPGGRQGAESLARWAGATLAGNGWPPGRKDRDEKPWYKEWWVWGILIAGAGVAAVLGGGGGSGGGTGSSVAVNF